MSMISCNYNASILTQYSIKSDELNKDKVTNILSNGNESDNFYMHRLPIRGLRNTTQIKNNYRIYLSRTLLV